MRLDPLLPPIVVALAAAGLVAGGVVSALRGARSFSRVAGVAMARLAATGALSVLLLRPIAPEPAETGGLPRALAIVERALAEPAALGAAARGGEVELFEFEAPAAGDRAEETRVGAPSSIDRRDTRSLGEASSAAIAACGALPGAALLVLGESAGTEDAAVLAARLCSLGARVWAIVPPQEEPRELRLGRVSIAPLEPRVNEPVVASAEMEARVPGPARVRASWSLDGRLATSQEIELRTGLNRVEHAFVCPSAGLHRLRVEVEPLDGETDPADNASGAFFRANAGLRRALLLEGTPRPVFRAIRRALAGAFALVASSAAERSRPSPGVPADEVSLDEFALVILGDLSASEFAPGALERLASWVRRGGGLLAVAGERNLGPGLWGLSALAPVLPVEVGPADGEVAGPLDARPAGRVGEPRPFPFGSLWAGVTPGAGEVPACSWRELPELARAREVSGLREGASVPLIAARPGRTVPLLVHGRAGKGRVAVILSDDVARWADAGGAARLAHDEFWRDLAAGLARELGAGETRIWLEAVPGLHTAGE